MAKEIERKFLVKHTDFLVGLKGTSLTQGYMQPGRYALQFFEEPDAGVLSVDWQDTPESRDGFVLRIPLSEYRELCERYVREGSLNTETTTVRARIADDKGFFAIKGLTQGIERDEYEYLIDRRDAAELQYRAAGPQVYKTRYRVEFAGHVFEVDIFAGHLSGLVLAEVELTTADELVELPDWIGEEVTEDARYYNSSLAEASAPPVPASVLTGIAA